MSKGSKVKKKIFIILLFNNNPPFLLYSNWELLPVCKIFIKNIYTSLRRVISARGEMVRCRAMEFRLFQQGWLAWSFLLLYAQKTMRSELRTGIFCLGGKKYEFNRKYYFSMLRDWVTGSLDFWYHNSVKVN